MHSNCISDTVTRRVRSNSEDDLERLLKSLSALDLSAQITYKKDGIQAHGGFCDVFKGVSTTHGDGQVQVQVAVKRLRVHVFKRKDVSKMLFRELKIWSSLRHPNVLPLLGYVLDGKYPCLVSLWMIKGTVRDCIDEKTPIIASKMAEGIASGLRYLHENGVIHSDLKCDNIFVSDEGVPLLADFGISHFISASTIMTSGTACSRGSARWMAKELLMVNWENAASDTVPGLHTKETDVWAFGMVLYELLTGDVPFPDFKNDLQVAMAIVTNQKPRSPILPLDGRNALLWSICRNCWDETPSVRPSMARICAEILLNEFAMSTADVVFGFAGVDNKFTFAFGPPLGVKVQMNCTNFEPWSVANRNGQCHQRISQTWVRQDQGPEESQWKTPSSFKSRSCQTCVRLMVPCRFTTDDPFICYRCFRGRHTCIIPGRNLKKRKADGHNCLSRDHAISEGEGHEAEMRIDKSADGPTDVDFAHARKKFKSQLTLQRQDNGTARRVRDRPQSSLRRSPVLY